MPSVGTPRTNRSDVREIFDTDLSNDALDAWIDTAHNVVQKQLADTADGDEVGSKVLEELEKYLAAHLASSQDPRVATETVGDAEFEYQRDPNQTDYWSVVVTLDPTGRLAGANRRSADFGTFGPGRD